MIAPSRRPFPNINVTSSFELCPAKIFGHCGREIVGNMNLVQIDGLAYGMMSGERGSLHYLWQATILISKGEKGLSR